MDRRQRPGRAVAAQARRRHAPEVRQQGEVPAADRRQDRQQGQRRHEERAPAGGRLRVAQDQRGLRRGRLRQPPRHRVRCRHRRVQADVGRVRQRAHRCAARGARRRRRRRALAARTPAAAGARRRLSIPRATARSSSAARCTPSRSRTTGWSTWPTGRIAACRCSRRTGSTSTQTFINRAGPSRAVGGRTRVLPRRAAAVPVCRRLRQLAHRGARSEEPATPLSVRAAQREAGRLPGPASPGDRFQGQPLHRRGRAGRARAAIRVQGTLEHAAAQRDRRRPLADAPVERRRPRRRLRARGRARFRHRVRRAAAIRRGPARWRVRTA